MDFKLPEVGENITSGTVVNIMVKAGDNISKDQDLLELETDKASLPVPAPCDGVIQEVLINEGDEVNIGAIVMKIEETAGSAPQENTNEKKEDAKQPEAPKAEEKPKNTPAPTPKQTTISSTPKQKSIPAQKDVPAAPSVRRLARELGIEISQVPGTGPSGRISKEDVKAYTKQVVQSGGGVVGGGAVVQQPLPDFSKWGNVEAEKMNNIRRKTAEHLSYCWQTIPHVTQFGKADITELENLRKKASSKERKLTITPFIMKVMAAALKKFPSFNSSVDMANQQIIYKKYCHIGVAVDTPRGLVVPVIRDVDQKGILEITDELNEIAGRMREGKISLDEIKGGSMTLTNLGGIGGTAFTPIVNSPEVAILGLSRGQWEQVTNTNGTSSTRLMLPLSLSYDHRVIDGADGARFLTWVASALQQPLFLELN